jgi:DNA-binding NtrC family response regulator
MFIRKFNQAHSKRITGISADTLSVLKKHEWPGNIRELENVIEHMFVMETSTTLSLSSLPEVVLRNTGTVLPEIPVSTAAISTVDDDAEDMDLSDEADLGADDGEEILATAVVGDMDFNAQKENFEKEFIIKALKTFKGRINQTALHANIPKKTLLRKIEKYGINAKDFSKT